MRPRPGSRSAVLRLALVVPALAGILTFDVAAPTAARAVEPAAARATDPGIRLRADRRPAPSHQVYGYLPYWQLDAGTAQRLDYRRLSTIAFFAIPIGLEARSIAAPSATGRTSVRPPGRSRTPPTPAASASFRPSSCSTCRRCAGSSTIAEPRRASSGRPWT